MRKLYAFDVDDTLWLSNGPVTEDHIRELLRSGDHTPIVGLCGNFALVTRMVPYWDAYFRFLGSMAMPKEVFLSQLRLYVPASEYVMVGNRPGDADAARLAAFRFISEAEFAAGQR